MAHRIIGNNEVAAAVNEEEKKAFNKRKIVRDTLKAEVPRSIFNPAAPIVSVTPQWTSQPLAAAPSLWDLIGLQIPSLWAHYGLRGEGINVYVLDSGCNAHSSITVRSVKSFLPGVMDTSDGIGHGTWVAGKIGGMGVGIAPKCNLHIGRVLDESGTGSSQFTVKALEWVLREPDPHIVNLSLGGTTPSFEQEKLILKLQQRGVIVVAAAGNQGSTVPFYPGSFDSCLTVGAVGRSAQKAEFSNFGGQIDIVAPGVSCYSTYLGNQFRALEGTSMATPIVAGVVALGYSLLKARRKSTVEIRNVVLDALLRTAQDLGPKGRDDLYGFGGIDAPKFMAAVLASN